VSEIWDVVHAEREALIRDLETLPTPRWATASLCPGWDVHDVLAHLVDDAKTTRLGFVRHLVAGGFNFTVPTLAALLGNDVRIHVARWPSFAQ
jgi:uncharacterized protein (TIGR03083 family)